MADTPDSPVTLVQFLQSKFDNLVLLFLIVFLMSMSLWADKHNSNDYVKWLEVIAAGFAGALTTLTTGARHALPGQNGNGNGTPPPAQSIGIVPGAKQ